MGRAFTVSPRASILRAASQCRRTVVSCSIDVVLDLVGLAERVEGAGLVITGEGSLDHQSLGGKTPIGVARMAESDVERCIRGAGPLLEQVGAAIGRDLPQLVE